MEYDVDLFVGLENMEKAINTLKKLGYVIDTKEYPFEIKEDIQEITTIIEETGVEKIKWLNF